MTPFPSRFLIVSEFARQATKTRKSLLQGDKSTGFFSPEV
jgi:hypothetical protein